MKSFKNTVCAMLAVALLSPSASAFGFGLVGGTTTGYWTPWTLLTPANNVGSVHCHYERSWINSKTGQVEKTVKATTVAEYSFWTRRYTCTPPRG